MKKTISILLCMLLATIFLAACSSGYYDGYSGGSSGNTAEAPAMPAPAPDYDFARDEAEFGGYPEDTGLIEDQIGGADATPVSTTGTEDFAEKIVYSVYAEIETMEFDGTIEAVNALLTRYNAFIESSNISGVNYAARQYGWNELRRANFSIRVPVDQLDTVTKNLDSLGNVIRRNTNAENITSQFYDSQSRLNTFLIQEERLLDMLKKAEDVTDMIVIEERLGEVRYEIESLTTMLRNWQNQVNYSYLTLSITEVENFTEITEPNRTYWQQIGDGFMISIRAVGRFFMDLFKWLVINAPVLVILAVFAIVIIIIIKRKIRADKIKRSKQPQNAAVYPNAPAYAPPQYYAPVPQAPIAPAPELQTPESGESGQAGEDN